METLFEVERDGVEGEICIRCGDVGEDRRTLFMSCFYAMEELGVPFNEIKVEGETFNRTGSQELWFGDDKEEQKRKGFRPHLTPVYSEAATGKITNRAFYTLRVCKACRSSWLSTLKDWFYQKEPVARPTGTGVFLRQFGKTYELTEEECINKWGMHWRETQE
jgi:hypothetical protein